jgi:predicted lipoprotein
VTRTPRLTPRRTPRRAALAAALATALLLGACSSDDGGHGGGTTAGHAAVLTALADGVIIPSYEALVTNVQALAAAEAALCTRPSAEGLEAARDAWRDTYLAWESSRATGVGPAIAMRSMQAIAFPAAPQKVEALIAGTDPITPEALNALGADVRGLSGVEDALFAPGAHALATAAGARRCEYAANATDLVARAARAVRDAWTSGGYRATFVRGMDGDAISSIEEIVSNVTFRLQQIDDQGLRSLAEAATVDDLPRSRREGPSASGLATLRGLVGGVAAAVLGPDGQPGLAALVRARSADTGDRLERLTEDAVAALRPLPDSSAQALAEDHAQVAKAAKAVAALRVLVTTEVASQLGVTIGFSDSDGDS